MVGRRIVFPKFKTKCRNFSSLESLMKLERCPRNVLGRFKIKVCPQFFDETGPWQGMHLSKLIFALLPLRYHAFKIF